MKEEHSDLVKEHFEMKYYDYDKLIRNLIPKYEEMHNIVIDSFNLAPKEKARLLDLGIGSGETALLVLERFPNAKIEGYDIAKNMIEQAKVRLKNHSTKVLFHNKDISKSDFIGRYDCVFSVLCIHHLNSRQKKKLFQKMFKVLKENGVFVIGDIIKFDSAEETKQKEEKWKEFLIKNLGEKEGYYWFDNYKEEDLPNSVNEQIKWLKNAGFQEVECIWEYLNYAIILARKKSP
ncbi:MAG: class I SAM-dependent methyltransferase [Nanoarchaeota archaeon]|nr:class I SAM-dependent methyltransferase [Nanoarchaeota archaeon]MBU1321190.1 class I SAM-dependent methyltransferase [Nanoarchaeota archaeon]MBU1598458.1 class I SAM-dependent methyltransferase [Nanoarchaeota archaeon]MBU2441391.1 class I SAM-dependent methyltransferase [Nanoarchaeota archaeon]